MLEKLNNFITAAYGGIALVVVVVTVGVTYGKVTMQVATLERQIVELQTVGTVPMARLEERIKELTKKVDELSVEIRESREDRKR